jgi:hypothetical protein
MGENDFRSNEKSATFLDKAGDGEDRPDHR